MHGNSTASSHRAACPIRYRGAQGTTVGIAGFRRFRTLHGTKDGEGMSSGDKRSTAIGFYTVVAHEQHGLFGGLLVLNRNGRPLEFHCTAPLKPNRAQEILYGATLESYL